MVTVARGVMVMMVLGAGVAAAHPYRPCDDVTRYPCAPRLPPPPPLEVAAAPPPVPVPPAAPRRQTFGFHTGVFRYRAGHEPRIAFTYGLAWGIDLAERVTAVAAYDFLVVGDAAAELDRDAHGRGHRGSLGLRVPVIAPLVGAANDPSGVRLRPHLDLQAGVSAVVSSDDRVGTHVFPIASTGAALGLQVVRAKDAGALARGDLDLRFEYHLDRSPDAFGWTFLVAIDWGR